MAIVTSYVTALVAALLGAVAGAYVTVLIPRAVGDEPLLRPLPAPPRPIRGFGRADLGVLAVTAAAFAVLALRIGLSPVLPAYLYLAAISVALAVVDVRTRRLPNAMTLPSYVIGLGLLSLAVPFVGQGRQHLVYALVGMVALYGCYLVLFLLYPQGMGFGDVKLAGILGLYLGWFGPGVLFVGAVLGYLFGGLYGLAAVLTGRATRKTSIPFGPFMIAGALLGVLAGEPIAAFYLAL